MPTNPAARPFGTARLALSFAVFVLVLLIVWVAVRAVGPADASLPPPVALPSAVSVSESPSPSPAPTSASPSPTASSPSPTPSKSRSAKPRRTPDETREPTTKPPAPKASFEATVNAGAGRSHGYMASVRISNTGEAPGTWRVTVSHDEGDIQLQGVWNASGEQDGSLVVFTGPELAPGASTMFGYQVTGAGRGQIRPVGCSASRGSCEVR